MVVMERPTPAPCGTWQSPLSASEIAVASIRIIDVDLHGSEVYWIEQRPAEKGRNVIVRRDPSGNTTDITPAPFNSRSRVHEYGGRSFCIIRDRVYFTHFDDQRIYVSIRGAALVPATEPAKYRYVDFVFDSARERLLCVREDHGCDGEPAASIVALELGGDGLVTRQLVLADGHDFFAHARVAPDGRSVAWLAWDHPCMPWDGTTLFVADVAPDGTFTNVRSIAGGASESVCQPTWSPGGTLYFVSDRTGWWNLYRWREGRVETITKLEAELGAPLWVLGYNRFGFRSEDEVIAQVDQGGQTRLAHIDLRRDPPAISTIDAPYTAFGQIVVTENRALCVAASPRSAPAVIELDLQAYGARVLKTGLTWVWGEESLSVAEPITFPAADGDGVSHALFYTPKNGSFVPMEGEVPPLIVISHGGPTSATSSALKLEIQYWTTRGFGVVDVNYGGSTGYGRAYRERLKGRWGEVDVLDCVAAARHLVATGRADPDRLVIRGASAGGYTTLAALAFHDVFKAGASYFGVSDLEALAKETHKFESRYLDSLIAPYPEGRDLYVARSPIHHADRLSCPVIFFQGLDDRVVPPAQAVAMVEALRAKGVPVSYVPFEGEQHGFRRAENIQRALEEELAFYARVFGFSSPDGT